MAALSVAERAVISGLPNAWREHKLPDDLPLLVHHREQELTDELRSKLSEVTGKLRTKWHHTHPCQNDRIAAIQRANASGVFSCDVTAGEIFTDFPEMSKMATIAYYTKTLGNKLKPQQIVPTESLVKQRDEHKQSLNAMDRYFGGLLQPLWPVFLPRRIESAADRAAAAENLLALRTDFAAALPPAKAAAEVYKSGEKRLHAINSTRAIRAIGLKPDPKKLDLASTDESYLAGSESQAISEHQTSIATIDAALAIGVARLTTALSLEEPEPEVILSDAEDDPDAEIALKETSGTGSPDRLLEALIVMRAGSQFIPLLGREFAVFTSLYRLCKPEGNPPPLLHEVVGRSRVLVKLMNQAYEALRLGRYPYAHVEGEMSISRYLMPQIPDARRVQGVGVACNNLLQGYSALYGRIMADLSQRAEQIEGDMGLSPLDSSDSTSPPPAL